MTRVHPIMRWLILYALTLMIALGILLLGLGIMAALQGFWSATILTFAVAPIIIGIAGYMLACEIKDPLL